MSMEHSEGELEISLSHHCTCKVNEYERTAEETLYLVKCLLNNVWQPVETSNSTFFKFINQILCLLHSFVNAYLSKLPTSSISTFSVYLLRHRIGQYFVYHTFPLEFVEPRKDIANAGTRKPRQGKNKRSEKNIFLFFLFFSLLLFFLALVSAMHVFPRLHELKRKSRDCSQSIFCRSAGS